MNLSQFTISYQNSIKLLKEFNLYKNIGTKPIGKYSDEIKRIGKENNKLEIYKTAINNLDYEILLIDDSIFQFSFAEDIRYAFIQNPNFFVSKEDYLYELFDDDELTNLSEEELAIFVNTINEHDYEQFLNEQNINLKSNFFRYDASTLGYQPLVHSYSHLHLSMNEDLRIPISKILTPLKFVMFCIKNTYFAIWKEVLDKKTEFQKSIHDSKLLCTPLNKEHWQDNEKFELHLD
jgi:hypothetical protein